MGLLQLGGVSQEERPRGDPSPHSHPHPTPAGFEKSQRMRKPHSSSVNLESWSADTHAAPHPHPVRSHQPRRWGSLTLSNQGLPLQLAALWPHPWAGTVFISWGLGVRGAQDVAPSLPHPSAEASVGSAATSAFPEDPSVTAAPSWGPGFVLWFLVTK